MRQGPERSRVSRAIQIEFVLSYMIPLKKIVRNQ